MRLILATLLALAAFPAAALAAPTVTTGDATSVGQTTATVTGTITPDGTEAPWVFEYGTTAEYGLTTAQQTVPAGTDPATVEAVLTGLSPETTYHYRLVSGEVQGEDKTFTTGAAPPQPSLPTISARGYTERTASSVVLKARIDPNRAATTYHVEWGYSNDLGRRTPDGQLPVRRRVGGGALPAQRAAGLHAHLLAGRRHERRGHEAQHDRQRPHPPRPDRRHGARAPTASRTGARASSSPATSTAPASRGMTVALEQATFPFVSPFAAVATARVNSSGDFSFRSRQALIGTHWRVVTRSTPSFTSAEVATAVRPRLSTRITRLTRRAARLKATVSPGLPGATATLQRRTASGRWFAVKRKTVNTIDELRSTVFFKANRKRGRSRSFRVKVKPASEAYTGVKGSSIRVSRRPRDKD